MGEAVEEAGHTKRCLLSSWWCVDAAVTRLFVLQVESFHGSSELGFVEVVAPRSPQTPVSFVREITKASSYMRAQEVKLLVHRWDLHAIQALASRDFELLARIFKELPVPEGAINSRVKTFGFGAPAQFHSYGFFVKDSTPGCSSAAAPMLEHVVEGDTLLLISLRHCDPQSVAVLINAGASLTYANRVGETAIQLMFMAYATIKLDDKRQQQLVQESSSSSSQNSVEPTAEETRIIANRIQYRALFALVQEQLDHFYDATKARIIHELETIYTQFAPERLGKLPAQLQDFEFKEHVLLANVRRKYCE